MVFRLKSFKKTRKETKRGAYLTISVTIEAVSDQVKVLHTFSFNSKTEDMQYTIDRLEEFEGAIEGQMDGRLIYFFSDELPATIKEHSDLLTEGQFFDEDDDFNWDE